jgi:hypothetical protein
MRQRTERYTPTVEEAEGMREGILAQRRREGLTGPHPYDSLRFSMASDRRLIAGVYASMVPRG